MITWKDIRPQTLFASISPVLIGLSLAFTEQHFLHSFRAIATLLCALTLQIFANLSNDYFDYKNNIDGNKRIGPLRGIHKNLHILTLKKAVIFTICLAFSLGLYLIFVGGLPIVLIGLFSLLFAFLYTGGPYPLSYYGLGEFLAIIFFGPIPVFGTYYLQTLIYEPLSLALVAGLGVGFIASAMMSLNNLRDYASDRIAGKRSLGIILGLRWARLLPVLGIILSTLMSVMIIFFIQKLSMILLIVLPLFFFNHWKYILFHPIDRSFNKILKITGQYLLLYGMMLSLCLIF